MKTLTGFAAPAHSIGIASRRAQKAGEFLRLPRIRALRAASGVGID
jgi:hypothetical protein